MDSPDYDVFISYARRDDADGWVSGLRDAMYEDFRTFSAEPFRIFFDQEEIRSRQDWELRLRQGLRSSRVLLVCLSPNYLRSKYCRWEWDEFGRLQARRIGGGDAVTGVFFVELGGDELYDAEVMAWRNEVERIQLEQMQPWFPNGVNAFQEDEVRRKVKALGQGVYEQLRQARLGKQAPGNLRRHNPTFVGRGKELQALRQHLSGGAVGVVTAVHGVGGMGKTELAVTYAHAYAHQYQGGTWQVDADGQTDMLEAVSSLALSPELGVEVGEQHLRDRQWLGRLVLARLTELTELARQKDSANAVCMLLLDNVSEPQLLSESQLAELSEEPWLHLLVTTRLGVNDVGAAGSRASVAMIEVGRLAPDDALELIRHHQPARDAQRLSADFSCPAEEHSAGQIVELLDGYALAIEQAAVYLGATGTEPSELLNDLRARGIAVLDRVGRTPETAVAIRHKEKVAAAIVDQTLRSISTRARAVLALASLLPPDTIPWDWLRQMIEQSSTPLPTGLLARSGGDDWAAMRRLLEGRRLLTQSDDPRFARLHRVVQSHLRTRLVDSEIEQLFDTHLRLKARQLVVSFSPDTALLQVTVATLMRRLAVGPYGLADEAIGLIYKVRHRLGLSTASDFARTTLVTVERFCVNEPDNAQFQEDLSVSLDQMGDVLAARGEAEAAFDHYRRSLQIAESLAAEYPTVHRILDRLSIALERVGDVHAERREMTAAREHYGRSLLIREQIANASTGITGYQEGVAIALTKMGDQATASGDEQAALDYYRRSLGIVQRICAAEPDNSDYQSGLTIALNRVGDALARRGDRQAALDSFRRSVGIAERITAASADNMHYQRDLSVSLNRVGDMLEAAGDLRGALDVRTQAMLIAERLAAADPDNVLYQCDVTFSLNRVGGLLADLGDVGSALDRYTQSLTICHHKVAADPMNSNYQDDLRCTIYDVSQFFARHAWHVEFDRDALSAWATVHRTLVALDALSQLSDLGHRLLNLVAQLPGLE